MSARTRIEFRCHPDERRMIEDKAKLAGLTLSEFVRRAALGRRMVSVIDRQMVGELRRLGALIKHHYPKKSNWTVEEKRRYWSAHEALMGLVGQIEEQIEGPA
jgi:hypothetical protein